MSNNAKTFPLWDQLSDMKSAKYKWVDLSHMLSAETPHWYGFTPIANKELFHYCPMTVYEYTVAGQYGTHVDVPLHFDPNGRGMHEIRVDEFAYPLCVVDKSEAVKANPDYALTTQDILDWEAQYGKIPEGAFVAFRSDWSKRTAKEYDNNDADGNAHYPGWDLDCVKFLHEQRNVGAIGHETSDTDPANLRPTVGFAAEDYILRQDKLNVEVLNNLDQVPPVGAVVFCVFPCLKDGTGFPARVFAICPAE